MTDPSSQRGLPGSSHGTDESICENYNPARPTVLGSLVHQQSHGFPARIYAPDVRQMRPRLSLCTSPRAGDYDDGALLCATGSSGGGTASRDSLSGWLTAAEPIPRLWRFFKSCCAEARVGGEIVTAKYLIFSRTRCPGAPKMVFLHRCHRHRFPAPCSVSLGTYARSERRLLSPRRRLSFGCKSRRLRHHNRTLLGVLRIRPDDDINPEQEQSESRKRRWDGVTCPTRPPTTDTFG